MSSIANLAVLLSLDSASFTKGLDKAAGQLKKWAAGIASVATVKAFANTIRELENVGDAAASAGVSIEAFTRITGSLDAEDTNSAIVALQKLGKTLAEVASGDQAARSKLVQAGLDPEKMVAAGIAGSMDIVAKKFDEQEDAIKKQGIAFSVWGKGATTVIPILSDIANGASEVRSKFGGVITEEEYFRIAKAKDALTSFDNALAGIKNRLAMELTPVVEEIVKGFGLMADALNKIAGAKDMSLGDHIVAFTRWATATAAESTGMAPSGTIQQTMKDFVGEKNERQKKFFDLFNARQAAAKTLQPSSSSFLLNKLFGENDPESRVKKASHWLGELAEGARKWAKGFSDARYDRAMELFDQTRTPFENFKANAKYAMQADAMKDLRSGVANRVIGQAFLDLEKSVPNFAGITSPSLRRGSSEAVSSMAQFEQMREGQIRDPQERVATILDIIKQIEAKQEQLLRDIANSVRNPAMAFGPSL